MDPSKPDGWDDRRVVSSAFIEQLLTGPYAAAIDRHGIRLRGAWFPNGLDVHEAAISFPLRCQACRIAGLQADGTVIDGTLDLRGSAIDGDLTLRGTDIRSDLLASDSSVVSGILDADGLKIAGDVFLRDGSRFNNINLLGATIGGNLEVDRGSVVSGTLDIDRATVGGDVFLRDGSTFNTIDLLGATIGGDLTVNRGSVVSGTLTADRAKVAGDVFLRDGSTFNTVILFGADIGGLIVLNGARWEPGGALDLRQARAGGVWTDERADSWPDTIGLNGFEFRQWANPDPRTLGAGWFTGTWLARLDTFSPGPYNQLAALLDAAGHPTIAADVRYHRSHTERLQTPWTRADRWGRQLHWLVLGYGFRPWQAAGWFFAVWLTGYLVFRMRLPPNPTSDEATDRPLPGRLRRWRDRIARVAKVRPVKAKEWTVGQAAMYSLDRLLPAFKLVEPGDFPTRTRTQQVWSVVQMLLGWMLTLFIIGWLGSLLVKA